MIIPAEASCSRKERLARSFTKPGGAPALALKGETPAGMQAAPRGSSNMHNLFCTNWFITPRFDRGLVVQDHVQQGIMDFQFSVVFNKTQLAEFVHEKTHP